MRGIRPENKRVFENTPVEWLLAESIADQKNRSASRVIEGEREHPVEPSERFDAILLIKREYDFGIAIALETITTLFLELTTEFSEIIDLAVEGDDRIARRTFHRLMTRS